jgi:hypothetical protein
MKMDALSIINIVKDDKAKQAIIEAMLRKEPLN